MIAVNQTWLSKWKWGFVANWVACVTLFILYLFVHLLVTKKAFAQDYFVVVLLLKLFSLSHLPAGVDCFLISVRADIQVQKMSAENVGPDAAWWPFGLDCKDLRIHLREKTCSPAWSLWALLLITDPLTVQLSLGGPGLSSPGTLFPRYSSIHKMGTGTFSYLYDWLLQVAVLTAPLWRVTRNNIYSYYSESLFSPIVATPFLLLIDW